MMLQLVLASQRSAVVSILALTVLSSLASIAEAAPQSLQSRVQSFLHTQGVNATIPASAYANASRGTVDLTCGILNIYRDNQLVDPHDGQQYTAEAEQHW